MGFTEFIIVWSTALIAKAGYLGIFFLMTLESMVAPVPSEAVMPFAGFSWFEGRFTFAGLVIASTLGSIVGSFLSYWIGAKGGRKIVLRYGKYLLLNVQHLETTERFFARHGTWAIFVSRFIPVVRHLISIPAGIGRMSLLPFLVYTTIGAGLWNAFLAWVGYALGQNWHRVREYGEIIDIGVVVVIILVCLYFVYRKLSRRSS